MELRDYWAAVRHYWWLLVITTVVGILVLVFVSPMRTPQYKATAQVFVAATTADVTQRGEGAYNSTLLAADRVESYLALLKSNAVLEQAAADSGVPFSAPVLSEKISGDAVPGTVMFKIAATDPDPVVAAALANNAARALSDEVNRMEEGTGVDVRISITDEAPPPDQPVNGPFRLVVFGALLGLVVGYILAVILEAVDKRIREPEDLLGLSGIRYLGDLHEDPEPGPDPRSESVIADDIRAIRSGLLTGPYEHPTVVGVASGSADEGRTTTATQLAIASAQAGDRVLLVDADLRDPAGAELLTLPATPGLGDVLQGRKDVSEAIQRWHGAPLDVLTAGQVQGNPADALGSRAFRELIAELRGRYDWVILDCPPALSFADTSQIIGATDGVLLVASLGTTRIDDLQRCAVLVARAGGRSLGVVLNRVPQRRSRRRSVPEAAMAGGSH